MWIRTGVIVGALLGVVASDASALDCDRVRAMQKDGKRPADIARELGITTPDVQGCLAGAIDDAKPVPRRPTGVGLQPPLPVGDGAVPRAPNQ